VPHIRECLLLPMNAMSDEVGFGLCGRIFGCRESASANGGRDGGDAAVWTSAARTASLSRFSLTGQIFRRFVG